MLFSLGRKLNAMLGGTKSGTASNRVTPPNASPRSLEPEVCLRVSLEQLVKLRFLGRAVEFPPRLKSVSQRVGQIESVQRGRGIDFDEVRRYQAGDDIRSMDWRVMARTGQPHTRLFHEERERPVHFWVDYSAGMYFGTRRTFKFVAAAEVAAVLAWSIAAGGDRVGGMVWNGSDLIESKPANGEKGVLHFLHLLERAQPQSFGGGIQGVNAIPDEVLTRFRRPIHSGSVVVIVADFFLWPPEQWQWLASLVPLAEVVLVQVSDPLEIAAPPAGVYPVSDGVGFARWVVDNKQGFTRSDTRDSTRDNAQKYTQGGSASFYSQKGQLRQSLDEFCSTRGIRLVSITTEQTMGEVASQWVASGKQCFALKGFSGSSGSSSSSGSSGSSGFRGGHR